MQHLSSKNRAERTNLLAKLASYFLPPSPVFFFSSSFLFVGLYSLKLILIVIADRP